MVLLHSIPHPAPWYNSIHLPSHIPSKTQWEDVESKRYSQWNCFDVANSVGKTLIRRIDTVLARIFNSQLKGSEFDNEPHKPLLRSKYLGHICDFLPESESFWSPLVPTVKGSLLFGAFSFTPSPRSTLGVLIDNVFSLSYKTGEQALVPRSRRPPWTFESKQCSSGKVGQHKACWENDGKDCWHKPQ